jgi:hypothetical protein
VRVKIWIARIGLAAGSSLLCVLVLEIALRLSGYGVLGERRGNVVHHRVGEFEHRAVLNSLDLRDTEIPPKAPDEFRVLALGDSFTYGLGVEEPDCYVRRTERALAARLAEARRPGRVRIVNGGVGGGPASQAEWLRHTGLALAPDLVVLGYFLGNDPYDDLHWHEQAGNLAYDESDSFVRRILRSSRAVDWTWARVNEVRAVDRLMFRLGLRRNAVGLYQTEQPELERRAWRHSLAVVAAIRDMLAEHRTGLLVLVIPASTQVRYGNEVLGEGADYRLPNRILGEFLTRERIDFVDLLPAMRDAPGRDGFYYVRDLHWTAQGHRFAAEVLADRLWPMLPQLAVFTTERESAGP